LHGRTSNEERYSPLHQISSTNVGALGVAWYRQFDTDRGQEATPIMVDGKIYVSTAWSKVFSFDARTGQLLWSFDPEVPGETNVKACCDVVNRGVAVADGRVFVATLDGRLIALNAKSGKLLWSVITVDRSKPYTSTGAPRVVKGKVVIGNSGAEFGVRGYVTAFDASTGKLVWRFYTVPGDPAKGPDHAASDDKLADMAKTWYGKGWIENGGGGTVWDSIVYDAEFNQLYIGVGNGGPYDYKLRSEGKGDNLFLSSIVALDPDTGKYRWHYQETPGEAWDYTATQNMILATLTFEGKPRKVLMQAPKNGLFYVIDRATGNLISADPYTNAELTWFQGLNGATGRPDVNPAAYYSEKPSMVSPGPTGVHSWHPMAFSPATDFVYVPVQESGALNFTATKDFKMKPGDWNTGTDLRAVVLPDDPAAVSSIAKGLTGALVAWDPVQRKVRWVVHQPYQRNGGVLATGGNLVFQGTADGRFVAYSADQGQALWEYKVGNGIVAAPISYAVDGEQYVAIMAGFGGSAITTGFQFPQKQRLPGRLFAFKLGGTVTPEAYVLSNRPPLQVTEPPADAGTIRRGQDAYQLHCMTCHGIGVLGGTLPDLRRSPAIVDKAAFDAIVLGGALSQNGMVSFRWRLSREDEEALRQFLQSKAREDRN